MTTQQRQHGKRSCYKAGCDRPECRKANAAYVARRSRLAAYGRPTTDMVDADLVRAHIRELQAAGMGLRSIAAAAGVKRTTLTALFNGVPHRGQAPRARMRAHAAEAVLAVRAVLPARALVDATGPHRRIQALIALGWSQARLAARLGWQLKNFNTMLLHADRVTRATATAVCALYDELWSTQPPTANNYEEAAVRRARQHAAERGWPPPMAWDDEALDDPVAVPHTGADDSRVPSGQRLPDGADLLWLLEQGETVVTLARRYGVREASVERALQRAGEGRAA